MKPFYPPAPVRQSLFCRVSPGVGRGNFEVMKLKLTPENLELVSQVMQDTKKEISYDKHTGAWSWYDKSERNNLTAWHRGYTSAWKAMLDATEPYL